MATWKLGDNSESVAKIQRWLYSLHKANPKVYANPGTIDGYFGSKTMAALKRFQKTHKIPQTGAWDDRTTKSAASFAKYVSHGKTTNPFHSDANQGIANDRMFVLKQFEYVYGRKPTVAELNYHTSFLQQGQARAVWTKNIEKHQGPQTAARMIKEILGRDATAAEITRYGDAIKTGKMNRLQLKTHLSALPEALLKPKPTDQPSEEQEDSRAYINGLLDEMGLGALKDWAWEQIVDGHSDVRIMQDLRQTDVYKTRFSGMAIRSEANLPQMSEAEYLAYEESAAQLMRQYGMPQSFWDQPADFASLIGNNVSVAELGERVQDGYVKVTSAPAAVRDKFSEWFGVSGDAALAAYFLDPDRATPLLQREIAAAEVGGIGSNFGYGFSKDRSLELAETGLTTEDISAGMSELDRMDPLFAETVDEQLDLTAEEQGADAVFEMGQADVLERRAGERKARTAGGGGAAVNSKGVGVGTAD